MKSLIHQHSTFVLAPDKTVYTPRVLGEGRNDGMWEAWIEFHPIAGTQPSSTVLATDRETTQPSREALLYWASGLEPIYFEGAFARAVRCAEA
jgi:hypothetical protein